LTQGLLFEEGDGDFALALDKVLKSVA